MVSSVMSVAEGSRFAEGIRLRVEVDAQSTSSCIECLVQDEQLRDLDWTCLPCKLHMSWHMPPAFHHAILAG